MISRKGLTLLAAVVVGAALMAPPAMAKCDKTCKGSIKEAFKTCMGGCKGLAKPDRKPCKKTCRDNKKTALQNCKADTNPNTCSPSGAFLDASLE